jgi:glutamate dehydrogenase (NAD(P)+)
VVVNPKELSPRDLENLTRRYASELIPLISPHSDIPAPDMGTNEQVMAWMMDTYSMTVGYSVPAIVTGKPINIGGSQGRTEATGRGVIIAMMEALKQAGQANHEMTSIVIQGFGNVGSNAAAYAHELGFRVIGISDVEGGVYNPRGLDIQSLQAHAQEHGTVLNFPNSDNVSNSELLTLPCDVLIPAAMEGQITQHNAPQIQAGMIVEAANGPTTPAADDILNERDILVVPDILANAGGVVVSYFEWVQDLQAFSWDKEEVFRQLQRIMIRAYDDTIHTAEEYGVDLRMAAQMTAIRRVAAALKTRGFYP